MRLQLKKAKVNPNLKRELFMLDGYLVRFIDEEFHCNGFIFKKYKDLNFSVKYFNKRFI
jgi:hypothetical protein